MRSNSLPLALLICGLGGPLLGQGAEPPPVELDDAPCFVSWVERERFRIAGQEQQELYRTRLPIPEAVPEQDLRAAPSPPASSRRELTNPGQPFSLWPEIRAQHILLAAAVCLGVMLALGRAVLPLGPFRPSATPAAASEVRVEEESFREFLGAFQLGLTALPARGSSPAKPAGGASDGGSCPGANPSAALRAEMRELFSPPACCFAAPRRNAPRL